jgi:hypothetical protein
MVCHSFDLLIDCCVAVASFGVQHRSWVSEYDGTAVVADGAVMQLYKPSYKATKASHS